jgi:hypothetical protein
LASDGCARPLLPTPGVFPKARRLLSEETWSKLINPPFLNGRVHWPTKNFGVIMAPILTEIVKWSWMTAIKNKVSLEPMSLKVYLERITFYHCSLSSTTSYSYYWTDSYLRAETTNETIASRIIAIVNWYRSIQLLFLAL